MSDHAWPMKDQMKIWIATWSTYCRMPPMGTEGVTRRSARRTAATRRPRLIRWGRRAQRGGAPGGQQRRSGRDSFALGEDAARPDEHHDDEDDEGDDVAHLGRDDHAADGDDLAHDEGGDEGPDHVPEAAEHADHEGQRPELAPEERVHGVLEDEERRGQPRHEPAHRR